MSYGVWVQVPSTAPNKTPAIYIDSWCFLLESTHSGTHIATLSIIAQKIPPWFLSQEGYQRRIAKGMRLGNFHIGQSC